jgi:hypothetical protein
MTVSFLIVPPVYAHPAQPAELFHVPSEIAIRTETTACESTFVGESSTPIRWPHVRHRSYHRDVMCWYVPT